MQLIIISLTFFFLIVSQELNAQFKKILPFGKKSTAATDSIELETQSYESMDWKKIDLDFLNSYYTQDGNNAAVTGGIGTEQLTDFTQKLILRVPVSKKMSINLDGGYDYYSSASTDNIDNVQSSASSVDIRGHGNVGISYKMDEQKSFSLRAGGSGEYDYTSISAGMDFTYLSKDKNSQFNIGGQVFIDKWFPYLPVELRGEVQLPTTSRNSYNFALSFAQVINQRLQASFMLESTYMNGLLSTPFHRVYFQEQNKAKLENLPTSRLKIPAAVRVNAHLSEWLLARAYYRFYWDDWGMTAHTASLELPIKINRFLSVYPFYRFHQQSAADYFLPYKQHDLNSTFYTSDYDLSALSSQAFGVGLSYAPSDGIFKFKLPFKQHSNFMLKSLDIKYSHYERSTGLKADILSLGLGFRF